MGHNDYCFPASQWATTTVITPDLVRHLDQRSSEAINGDAGGTYAPKKPIVIGGAGLQLKAAPKSHAMKALATGRQAAVGGGIILSSLYPTMLPPRQRNTVQHLMDVAGTGDVGNQIDSVVNGAVVLTGDPTRSYIACRIHARRLHDGATLNRITLTFKVASPPASFPSLGMPGFIVRRVDSFGTPSYLFQIPTRASSTAYSVGGLVVPSTLNGRQFRCITPGTTASSQPAAFGTSAQTDTVTDGTVVWRSEIGPTNAASHFARLALPANAAAAYGGGAVQSITMNCNLNTVIDTANYSYFVEIRDYFPSKDTFFALAINQLYVSSMQPAF